MSDNNTNNTNNNTNNTNNNNTNNNDEVLLFTKKEKDYVDDDHQICKIGLIIGSVIR
jgi:hypothetical protein